MPRIWRGLLPFLALFAAAVSGPAQAADVAVKPGMAAPGAGHGRLATVVPPTTAYGCKRIWRCDKQVCEWRRGCWGVYGYIEGPYYSVALAQRQWERDGLPGPAHGR